MGERYDWRAEVRKRLGISKSASMALSTEVDALYEFAAEKLGIPKTPPEPTDEELLDEVSTVLGRSWLAVSPTCVARLFLAATKPGSVDVWYTAANDTWHARVGNLDRAQAGDGPTPADALRAALAAWLRAEWRKKQEGGERCS